MSQNAQSTPENILPKREEFFQEKMNFRLHFNKNIMLAIKAIMPVMHIWIINFQ